MMMHDNEYDYINLESIDKCLKCPLCNRPFTDPVSTKCNNEKHRFCRHCVINEINRNPVCPTCKQNLHIQDLIPIIDDFLIDHLNKIPIKCLACQYAELNRGNFDVHKNGICLKATITCPSSDIGCRWTGARDEVDRHLNTCSFNQIKSSSIRFCNENQQVKDQLEEQKTQIGGLITNIKLLNNQVDQLQLQTTELIKDNKQLNNKVNQHQDQLRGLQAENQQLKNQLVDQSRIQTEGYERCLREIRRMLPTWPASIENMNQNHQGTLYLNNRRLHPHASSSAVVRDDFVAMPRATHGAIPRTGFVSILRAPPVSSSNNQSPHAFIPVNPNNSGDNRNGHLHNAYNNNNPERATNPDFRSPTDDIHSNSSSVNDRYIRQNQDDDDDLHN